MTYNYTFPFVMPANQINSNADVQCSYTNKYIKDNLVDIYGLTTFLTLELVRICNSIDSLQKEKGNGYKIDGANNFVTGANNMLSGRNGSSSNSYTKFNTSEELNKFSEHPCSKVLVDMGATILDKIKTVDGFQVTLSDNLIVRMFNYVGVFNSLCYRIHKLYNNYYGDNIVLLHDMTYIHNDFMQRAAYRSEEGIKDLPSEYIFGKKYTRVSDLVRASRKYLALDLDNLVFLSGLPDWAKEMIDKQECPQVKEVKKDDKEFNVDAIKGADRLVALFDSEGTATRMQQLVAGGLPPRFDLNIIDEYINNRPSRLTLGDITSLDDICDF